MTFPVLRILQGLLQPKIDKITQQLKDLQPYQWGSLALNQLVSKRGYHVQTNIAYGLKARQRLDLYISHTKGVHPLVVFVHGGAWSKGSKEDYRFFGESLTQAGYDVAIINYHLAPEHKFPSYIKDLHDALQFLVRQANRLGVSADQIALIGHSAGAFNVASLLYHPVQLEQDLLSRVKVMIGLAGPYHFNYVGDVVAEPAFDLLVPYQQVMPYYFVQSNHIQHYLFLAEQDQLVKDHNSEDLQQQLHLEKNHCEIIRIPRTNHISLMASTARIFTPFFQTRKQLLWALQKGFN